MEGYTVEEEKHHDHFSYWFWRIVGSAAVGCTAAALFTHKIYKDRDIIGKPIIAVFFIVFILSMIASVLIPYIL